MRDGYCAQRCLTNVAFLDMVR
uniref:Uncharacterized protein n=1 Tax=Anguilla anguilla TaxID=7936 RepID=A0A0E9QJ84_ANGAN